jgi:DNA (cytosine-5)-methyltransferase 1
MNQKISLTLGSLFDGIGGFPYAASFWGITPLWASEIFPAAVSVTKRHFPEMEHKGDITRLDGKTLPPVDIVCFGSPCTDLSVAGRRAGLDGRQSSLFYEAIRIIKEMRCVTNGKSPRYAIFENVPGLFSSHSGCDYKAVLEAFTESEIPMPKSGKWANAGMVRSNGVDIAWCVFDAQHFGLAQRRKRVFLVADFRGTSAGEILFVPKSLCGNPAQSGKTGQGTSHAVTQCTDVSEQGNVAAFMGGASPSAGSVSYSKEVSPTLRAGPGSTMTPCVVEILNDQGGGSINIEKDGCSPTLRHSTHGNLPVVCLENDAQPHAVTMRLREGCEGGGKGALLQIEKSGTLATSNDQYLFCAATAQANAEICENLCPTITGAAGTSGNNKPYISYGFDLQQITSKTNRSSLKEVQPSLCSAGNPHVVQSGSPYRNAYEIGNGQADSLGLRTVAGTLNCMHDPKIVVHPAIAGTLCSSAAGLTRPAGMASETDLTIAYCLQGNMIGRDDRHGPAGGGVNEDVSYTLNGTDRHAVAAIPINTQIATRHNAMGERTGMGIGNDGDPAYTLQEAHGHAVATTQIFGNNSYGGFDGQPATLKASGGANGGGSENIVVNSPFVVRRLTPLECERLMGFPDGWTAFGCDGEAISDNRRYQMLGNSVAIPCVAYIMQGIVRQYRLEESNWK